MTATLPFVRFGYRRHPSWYAMLLLPVLPLIRILFTTDFVIIMGGGIDPTRVVGLLVLGVLLALGLPGLVEQMGHRVRKEVELLRPAWIGSVLILQVSLLPWREETGLDKLLFAVSSMLLAALPFGAEFQQRTLSNLLSQPMSRDYWWHLKTRVLAVALGLQALVYLMSRAAFGHPTSLLFTVSLLITAAVAWGTAPWWTLLVRSLLAGFVFAITAPLLSFFLLVILLDVSQLTDSLRIERLTGDEVAMYFLLFVALPFYAVYGAVHGYCRWMKLEASDHPTAESGAISLPSFRNRAHSGHARLPVLTQLVAKEFRVQTVTLLMGVAAVVMAAVSLLPVDLPKTYETMIPGGCMLLAAATILLAGATTVAEERRLGTLNTELLLPISRSYQWWVKFLVAACFALPAGALLLARSPMLAIGFDITQRLTLVLILVVLFATALLASSTAPNSLRALLNAAGLAALALIFGNFLGMVTAPRWDWDAGVEHRWAEVWADLPEWRRRVADMNGGVLEARYEWVERQFDFWTRSTVPFLSIAPSLLAIFFARRNFLRPDGRRHRLALQFGLCCLLMLAFCGGQRAVVGAIGQRRDELVMLLQVKQHERRESRLSVAERELYSLYGDQDIYHRIRVPIRGRFPQAVAVPLSPDDRLLLIEQADGLPLELLEALRKDADRDPRKPTPKPAAPRPTTPATPAPNNATFQMSPELMRRYGLVPRDAAPAISASAPTSAPAATPPPSTFRMSPELMRRYGLTPAEPPKPTPPPPAP